MSSIRSLVLLTVFSFSSVLVAPPAAAQAPAAAYVIADQTTGFVLESVAPQKKLQVGSLTKIATAMTVLDWAASTNSDLGQLATVPESAQALVGTNGVGFRTGDRCSLRDLLYAALMQSDNQAAETLATHVGTALPGQSNVPASSLFVAQMNALARRLGMTRTRFLNAHGLDGTERSLPYSTAEDLAKLTQYAMSASAFRFYVSQKERKISLQTDTGETQYLLRNTNELLGTHSIDGVKTGTTRKAGQCVIVSAARPPESKQEGATHIITPRRINVVLLGATDRFGFAEKLLVHGEQVYDAWAAAGRPTKDWKAPR